MDNNEQRDYAVEFITTPEDAEQLPIGTVIGIPPLRITTAKKYANMFNGGRSGWVIAGLNFPVSDKGLFNYGHGWTVQQ
jgi:hypothetical protein